MRKETVGRDTSRRQFMKAIAVASSTLGVAVTSVRGRLFNHQASLSDAQLAQENQLRTMLAPLRPGSELIETVVDSIWLSPNMVGQVRLRDRKTDQLFTIDICGRSQSASSPRAVATTANYSLFLRNGGAGQKVTPEHIGLSLMAVAEKLSKQEKHHPPLALLTDAEHTTLHG